jgi:hypothetical protein
MQWIRSISLLTLAALILFVSSGFKVSKHYCGGELKNTALFTQAEACNHSPEADAESACPNAGPSCPMHQQQEEEENKNCCEDEEIFLKSDQDLKNSEIVQMQIDIRFMGIFYLLDTHYKLQDSKESPGLRIREKPPQRGPDLRVELQSFLC